MKFKETISKELEKLKQENEKKTRMLEDHEIDFDQFKAEAESAIERLRKANERMSQENLELDTQYMNLQKDYKNLQKHTNRLSSQIMSGSKNSGDGRDSRNDY